MKKIATVGCSFTWGQGLWYYHTTNEYIPKTYEYLHNIHAIPQSALEFKDRNNWPAIVSSHFDATYIMKSWNGGTDDESVRFIEKEILSKEDKPDLLIFQTTQLYRSPFEFDWDGEKYIVKSQPDKQNLEEVNLLADGYYEGLHVKQKDFGKFFDWAYENDVNPYQFENMFLDRIVNRIEDVLKKCEEVGIKTLILCWTEEYRSEILRRKFLTDRYIRLEHNGVVYTHIDELQQNNKHLIIALDDTKVHVSGDGTPPKDDWHPSLECHKIIANNVIRHIEKNG